jgi:hypothetical protein
LYRIPRFYANNVPRNKTALLLKVNIYRASPSKELKGTRCYFKISFGRIFAASRKNRALRGKKCAQKLSLSRREIPPLVHVTPLSREVPSGHGF